MLPRVLQRRANYTVVQPSPGVVLWFSYDTLVAFSRGGCLVVRENEWGPTTGKHLNWIDGGDKAGRVSDEVFEHLWKTQESLVEFPEVRG